MKKQLLIIEDEASVAKQLKWGLDKEYKITIVSNAEQARPLLARGTFSVITLDLGLPPFPDTTREGFTLLNEIISLFPQTKVIVITGNDDEENAIKAISLGATDFCAKPVDLKLLKVILSRTFRILELEDANTQLRNQTAQSVSLCGMTGISPVMNRLFERIRQVSETDYSVLITGKSGTGKEKTAHAIHTLSSRTKKSLIIINCGAIPENLMESELFGYEKGAFTGAVSRKIGKLEQADNGTLFLDEIGELPLAMQVKILRFLQEGTIERLGGITTIPLNVRIIAATNIDLKNAVEKKTFRRDLFYRVNVVPLEIPALKSRDEDILLLAQQFLSEETRALKRKHVSFSPAALTAIMDYDWPGNVRQLQNRVRLALTINSGKVISPADMDLEETDVKPEKQKIPTLKHARESAEIIAIRRAMTFTGNNITQAAKILKISRPTLHDLLKKHKIGL